MADNSIILNSEGVIKSKVDLSKYFHPENNTLKRRFEIIYQMFNLNDSKIADKIGIARQTMNRYRRGVWIPVLDLKLAIARAISELADYRVDSAVIWGEDLIFEQWKDKKMEDKKNE